MAHHACHNSQQAAPAVGRTLITTSPLARPRLWVSLVRVHGIWRELGGGDRRGGGVRVLTLGVNRHTGLSVLDQNQGAKEHIHANGLQKSSMMPEKLGRVQMRDECSSIAPAELE